MAGRALTSTTPEPPSIELPFAPRGLLRNAHLQSMLGNLPLARSLIRRRARALRTSARELVLDCGEGVRLQGFYSATANTPPRRIALLLHGWEGNADSSYVLSLSATLYARGYDVLRLNLRDHGATHHLNRDIFHSCRLPEVIGATRAITQQFPGARLFLGGFSLGGNFMLRVAADAGAPASIQAVVAISPVLEPAVTLRALEQGSWLYRYYFVRRWTQSLRNKQRAWPGVHDFRGAFQVPELRAMTAALVREFTAFPSLDAYLSGYAITGERLATLRVPASLLLSEDDPMIPAADLKRLAASPLLTVARTRHGGHCGFVTQVGQESFADRFVAEQFARYADT